MRQSLVNLIYLDNGSLSKWVYHGLPPKAKVFVPIFKGVLNNLEVLMNHIYDSLKKSAGLLVRDNVFST